MAVFRKVNTNYWNDSKIIEDMTPEDRYFMLYLMTNPHTNQIGCYSISIKQMEFETGYNKDSIEKLIKRFTDNLKLIEYSEETKEILILNWHKYNWSSSPKVLACMLKEYEIIKNEEFRYYINSLFIEYEYNIDTETQKEKEKEKEKKEEKLKEKEPTVEDLFLIFYQKYPLKKSKQKALLSFNKALKITTFEKIMQGLDNYIKDIEQKKTEKKYIKHPTTWLNQGCWDDEYETNITDKSKLFEIMSETMGE